MNSALIQFVLDKDREFNKKMFDNLYANKSDIEDVIGETLAWRRMDDQKRSAIQVEVSTVGLADETTWGSGTKVISEKFKSWEKAFKPYVVKLSKMDAGNSIDGGG